MAYSAPNQAVQSNEASLPWERFEGLLWGWPATWWMIIRHPMQAFSAKPQAGWMRAWGFALIIFTPILYFDYLFSMLFYLLGNILSSIPDIEPITRILLAAFLLPLTLPLDLFLMEALPLQIIFWVFTLKKIPLHSLTRICFYSLAVSPLFLIGFRIGLLGNIVLTVYYFFGLLAIRPGAKIAAVATCMVHLLFRYEIFFVKLFIYSKLF